MVPRIALLILISFFILQCGSGKEEASGGHGTEGEAGKLAAPVPAASHIAAIPELAAYKKDLERILTSPLPVLTLPDAELHDEQERLAQELALGDSLFLKEARKTDTGEALHNEIMEIRLLQKEETQRLKLNCENGQCYWVELYNFFYRNTTAAIVDILEKKVLRVDYLESEQPALNARLKRIAREIALNTPEIKKELGAELEQAKVVFKDSKCERSLHLCVAVVFILKDRALWVIVDLNDHFAIGYKWSGLPDENRPFVMTERSLQNEYIMEHFCGVDQVLTKDEWEINSNLTSSDGLEVKNARFRGREVLHSAKIVDWHVSYSFKKDFGYSDAMGCPMFSSAANVAFRGTELEDIVENGAYSGFALIMDFRSPVWPLPCNYRYQNRYEFYKDGRFRICGVNMGQGCGVTGWYRPVFRIDLGQAGAAQAVEQWGGKNGNPKPANFGICKANKPHTPPKDIYSKFQRAMEAVFFCNPGPERLARTMLFLISPSNTPAWMKGKRTSPPSGPAVIPITARDPSSSSNPRRIFPEIITFFGMCPKWPTTTSPAVNTAGRS
ncbi:MAG: hypothetical protein IPJ00_10115 [Saprospirales bacterium]|nr:hypothetical protein [Saprospirales bacterium]